MKPVTAVSMAEEGSELVAEADVERRGGEEGRNDSEIEKVSHGRVVAVP
jgi:hypothetical protein